MSPSIPASLRHPLQKNVLPLNSKRRLLEFFRVECAPTRSAYAREHWRDLTHGEGQETAAQEVVCCHSESSCRARRINPRNRLRRLEQRSVVPFDPRTHQKSDHGRGARAELSPQFFRAVPAQKENLHDRGHCGRNRRCLRIAYYQRHRAIPSPEKLLLLTVVHRHDPELLDRYAQILLERGVEGFITVDMRLREALPSPRWRLPATRPFPGLPTSSWIIITPRAWRFNTCWSWGTRTLPL